MSGEQAMLIIKGEADLARALASSVDAELKRLLTLRRDQLLHDTDYDLEELANFIVAQPGDLINAIEAALGFPVAVNLVDGARFGDPEFEPSFEWIEQCGEWFELAFILSDDGFGHVLLVPDIEGVDPVLLALCRTYCHLTA
jgi:hypothetical protein